MYLELVGFDNLIGFEEQNKMYSPDIKAFWVYLEEKLNTWDIPNILEKSKLVLVGEVFEFSPGSWGYEAVAKSETLEEHVAQRNVTLALGKYPPRRIYGTREEAAGALINEVRENK